MQINLEHQRARALDHRKRLKKTFQRIKKRPPKDLDQLSASLHEEVFEEIDCLDCANCCKTTSPIFRDKDIERLSGFLRIRPSELVEKYLQLDADGHYVLHTAPCPFLGTDNYCSVYEARPLACREYPHTNRKNFHQILNLTLKNTEICPATLEIVLRMEKALSR